MENSLFSVLFDQEEPQPLTVTQLSDEIRTALETKFRSVWVEGEITNFHAHGSGHWYFSLTDGSSFIRAACFKQQNFRIRFMPENGLQVRVRGRMNIYGSRGELQILVDSLEPVGEGALLVAYEQIKAKLNREGLFDERLKRPIPTFPRRVGIVTSPTGAALQDILTVLERRARNINVVIIPTLVQGERAGEQIARAIALANEYCDGCLENELIDVLIVGRGGGSSEDLWAFNEEHLARAIRSSRIPIISAVGHEVDFTIADLVADLRAPTPSAAAELVARAEAEVTQHLIRSEAQLHRSISFKMLEARTEFHAVATSRAFTGFHTRINELSRRVDGAISSSQISIGSYVRRSGEKLRSTVTRLTPVGLAKKVGRDRKSLAVSEQRIIAAAGEIPRSRSATLQTSMARLHAMSPLRVLDRGYAIAETIDGRILTDAIDVDEGDPLKIRLARGKIEASVTARSTD
jgi:exodeoxyribonuclease VII large subunit